MNCKEIINGKICGAQMTDGFALIPTWSKPAPDFLGEGAPAIGTINIDGAEITKVFKCPSCGHSVER